MNANLYLTFVPSQETANITKKMTEDREFLKEGIDHNSSFLKSIPNSAQYRMSWKKDLLNMMRQLGKPTLFLTLSANETIWPTLIQTLYKLKYGKNIEGDPLKLNALLRSTLVNEDPIVCVLYFNKLVDVIINILSSKGGPFGKYKVLDFFKRIEFQHRGSPHAHILHFMVRE